MSEIDPTSWWQPAAPPPTMRELWDQNRTFVKASLIVMALVVITAADHLWPLLLVALAVAAYFAPSIVATLRHVRNQGSVVVVNLFLGWTFLGWVAALAMACRSVEESPR